MEKKCITNQVILNLNSMSLEFILLSFRYSEAAASRGWYDATCGMLRHDVSSCFISCVAEARHCIPRDAWVNMIAKLVEIRWKFVQRSFRWGLVQSLRGMWQHNLPCHVDSKLIPLQNIKFHEITWWDTPRTGNLGRSNGRPVVIPG